MGLLVVLQLLLLCAMAVHGQDPTVTIGPDLVTGTEEIVSGSDIQLFCTATSTTGVAPAVAWARNGATLDNNPPSVYFRTSSDGTSRTSSVLTIGDFQSADDGTYTCIGSIPGSGTTVSSDGAALTAVTFTDPNDANEIFLTRDPTSRETTFEDDRVSVPLGTQFDPAGTANADQVMVAAATLGSFRNLETQSIVWVRDGVVIAENGVAPTDTRYTLVATTTNVGGTDPGLWRTALIIDPFEVSVAGVYQVIFTDAFVGGEEVLTTTPIRLDTDEAAALTRVSPAIIDLVVGSEALLIEVSASGGYEEITWQRNGMSLTGTFVSHDEVYYKEPTDDNDRGEYTITAATGGVGPSVTVAVLPYTTPSTTIMGSAPITVVEGGSVDITCTSTGILTPTIAWELDGTDPLPFIPMDGTPVDPVITQVSPLTYTNGSLTSVLPITNAVFPTHEGMYRCTGTNTHNGVSAIDVATVQVTVQVTPEVQVMADRSRIQIGGMITLTCTVTRSNPSDSYMYTWTLLPSTNITGPTSSTESTNTLQVTPDGVDDYGTYRCSVDNGALTGTANATIEQGFPPVVSISGAPTEPTTATSVDLTCMTGNGDLPITFEWVDVADPGVTLSTNAMYTVTVSVEVTYRCTAMNEFGTDSDEVTVVEALPPVINPAGPTPVSVMVGETLTLEVNITEFNLPLTVTWSFGGFALMDGIDRISITTSADLTTPPVTSTLIRMPILSLEDEGNYDVTASNLVDNLLSRFQVTVNAPPTITFPTEPTEVTVSGGDTVTLTCSAFGAPAPEFEWFMASNMTALMNNDLSGRVTISSMEMMSDFFYVNSTLEIDNTEASDAATYTCRATNSVDTVDVEETYTLIVNVQAMITGGPADTEAEYLSNVSLSCTARGIPVPDFTWTVDSGSSAMDVVESGQVSITTMPTGTLNEQMSTLALMSVEPSLANYTCNASNSLGSDSSAAILDVQAEPQILSTVPADPTTANVNIVLDIVLNCTARGAPEPTFAWFRGATELPGSDPRVTITPGPTSGAAPDFVTVESTLTITESLGTDAGAYSCVASNTVFSETRSDAVEFTLMINFPAMIVQSPADANLLMPESLTLTCGASGVPPANFTWQIDYLNGSSVLLTESIGDITIMPPSTSDNQTTSILRIGSTERLHTGNYTCIAQNEQNVSPVTSDTAEVNVFVAPMIETPLEDFTYEVLETNETEFECIATGFPAPTITFSMGSLLLDREGSESDTGFIQDRVNLLPPESAPVGDGTYRVTRRLMVFNAMDGDSGTYTCNASSTIPALNPMEYLDSRNFGLLVLVAPTIIDAPENLTVVQPDDATFSCQATGRPRPTITWWRFTTDNGFVQILMTDSDYSIEEMEIGERDLSSTLTILGTMPGDTGEYLCQAESTVGSAAESAFLTVQVVPEIIFTEDYTVNQFDEVVFECRATGIPAPYINWYRNGIRLNAASDSRISLGDPILIPPATSNDVYEVSRTLTFNCTRDDDTGTYFCVAANENARMPNVTQNFELFVRVAPVILTPPENLTVVEPDDATFFCEATARPGPNITWWRRMEDGGTVQLMDGTDYTIVDEATGERIRSSTLTVNETQPSDALDYFCLASNMAGVDEATAELIVHVIPEIIFTEDYVVNQFQPVTFECTATGIPAPYINWYRNGDLLNGDFDPRISLSDPAMMPPDTSNDVYEVSRTLTFNYTRDDDTGTYTCVAGNGNAQMPNVTQDFELFIRVAPVILTPPENLTVVQPEDASFFCEATARPGPTITWWRMEDGGAIQLMNGADYTIVDGATGERIRNSTLTVVGTQPSDALEYFCMARNMAGVDEATAELTVHVVPEIIFTEDYTVNQFDEVVFECRATGIPAPYINWYRNGIRLNAASDSRISLSDPVMTPPATSNDVYEVSRTLTFNYTRDNDTGTYTCVAANENARMPNVTRNFELFVRVAPMILTPPENLTVVQPEDADFFCEATARPGPNITWWRMEDGGAIQLMDGTDYTIVDGATGERIRNSTLTVNETQPSDALSYFCMVRNVAGVEEAIAELTVHVVPEIIFTEDYTVNQFDEVVFECRATGIPAPYINWYRNGIRLNAASDSRISLSDPVMTPPATSNDVYEVSRTLTFNYTRDNDTGTYTCVAANENARMPNVTRDFELFVRVAPMILTPPENLTVVQPEDADFFCEATARPGPNITWWRMEDGGAIQLMDGTDYTIVDGATGERIRNSTLTVNETQPSDALSYFCMVRNVAGVEEAIAELTVHVVPEIIFTEDYTVNQFVEVVFECRATGIPAPYINWYRNGIRLNAASDSRISLSDPVMTPPATSNDVYEVSRTLTFNYTRDNDTGTYTCVAANENARMPNVTRNFELFVRVAPMILTPPENLTVVQPEDADFFCEATARPGPNITWWRMEDGGAIQLMDGTDYTIVDGATGERIRNSTLTVNETQPSDALSYFCMVRNVAGVEEAIAELTVHVVPEIIFTEDYTVNQFDEVVFECRATGIPAPYINWYRNGIRLNAASDSRISLSDPVMTPPATSNDVYEVSRTLTFNYTRDNDTGTYTCVAANENARMPNVTQDFELFVRVAPMILTPPENLTVVQPEDADFFCEATARPGPNITWWRMEDGGAIQLMDGTDYTIVDGATGERIRNSTLTVNETQPSDSRDYFCMARNMAGVDEATAELTVHVVPEIIFTEDYTVNQFDEVVFECRATGIPAPYINWYRNGIRLNAASDSRISLSDPVMTPPATSNDVYEVSRTLTFNYTRDNDTGTYTCVAANENARMPNVTRDFELFVRVAPMILTPPENLTVVQPDDASFFCEATARPGPNITWWRTMEDGGTVQLMDGTDYTIVDGATGERIRNSTLTVVGTQPSDAQDYFCMGSNMAGVDEATAELIVHVVPEITFTEDYIVNQFQPVTFECNATGIPAPYINWYRDGDRLNEAFDSRISLSDLVVTQPATSNDTYEVYRTLTFNYTMDSDTNNYTCVAGNGNARMPNVTQDFQLFVRVAPMIMTPPENLTVVQPEDANFFCEATARPGPNITWWRMEDGGAIQLMDGADYTIVDGATGERIRNSTLTVVGTQPSDALDYFCRATNIVDDVEATAELIVHVVPVIVAPAVDSTLSTNEGQLIEFSCRATGIPAPTISWYRNDVLFNNNRTDIDPPVTTPPEDSNDVYTVRRTLILDPTMDSDSGTYTCVADNGNRRMPNVTRDFELFVRVAPRILVPPQDLTVVSPNNAMFFCQATGRPGPDITWWRRRENGSLNQIMEETGVYNILNDAIGERVRNSTLVIVRSEPFDTGEYLCLAVTENVPSTKSATANLTVYVIPDIVFPESDSFTYTVNVTDPVTFVCRARGVPVPVITWNRNGLSLNGTDIGSGDAVDFMFDMEGLNSRIIVEPPSQSLILTSIGNVYEAERNLTIYDTMGVDTGPYTCEADNGVEPNDTQEFELFVQVPPVVIALADEREVIGNETDSVTLEFQIDNAAPLVALEDLTWYYSAILGDLPQGEDITGLMNRTSQSMLTFSEFTDNTMISLTVSNLVRQVADQGETDEGRYFLVARNPAGISFDYIDLIIFGAPTILVVPEDQFEINDGSNATFRCEVFAFPLHEVDWTFTDASGTTTSIISTSDVQDSMKYSVNRVRTIATFGILTVQDVQYEDRGRYNCTARNILGSGSAFATLTVHVTPVIEDISDTTEVNVTNSATLACLTTAFPLVSSITWQKNGEDLLFEMDGRISIFEFEINDTYMSSGFLGSGSIESVVSMAGFTDAQVDGLGDLGVVGVLTFESLVRNDTASYTCTATNSLPQTAVLSTVSDPISLVVLERPDPPVNVEAFAIGALWVAIRWQPEFDGNRPVQQFVLHQRILDGEFVMVETLNIDVLMFVDGFYRYNISTGILAFTNYSFAVQSCNELGCSEFSDASEEIRTDEFPATAPQNLRVATGPDSVGQRYIILLWDVPIMPNGIIARYRIYYTGTKEADSRFSDVGDVFTPGAGQMMNLTGLTPDTVYTITVAAINGAGEGDRSTAITQRTDMAPPDRVVTPSIPEQQTGGDRTATIGITRPDDTNGPLSHYQVIAVLLPTDTTPQSNGLLNPDTDYPSLVSLQANTYEGLSSCLEPTVAQAYIAAEFSNADFPNNNQYIVGLETQPNDQQNLYRNGPLCYARTYTFFLRAYPLGAAGTQKRQTDNRQYDLFSSSSYTPTYLTPSEPASIIGIAVGVVVGVIAGVAIIIVIVVIVYYIYRKRRVYVYKTTTLEVDHDTTFIAAPDNLKLTEYNAPVEGTLVRQPIPVGALAAHVDRMHANENCGFGEEYKVIQENSPKNSVEACIAPDNKPRNRYANIQCFDHSRVHLTRIEGFEHDYINGNFINGYNHRNEYIATQGPLPDTVGDFWRLVWDQDCTTIVMLTNLVEKMKVKCTQYWPSSGTQQYSNISVSLKDSTVHADFVIRHYQIKNVNSDEVKDVSQFHFISWPDFGVPRHATPLLYFLRRIRTAHPYSDQHPILIHCSAGVGRTGSLITIDVDLQRARQEGVVDPFNSVLKMRQQRNHMVQTEAQYVFIHDAILEGITSGNTEISVDRLGQRMSELESADSDGETGYRKEFNRLRQFKVNVREFTDANDDANKFKNRIANALPYNYNRVHLQMSPGVGGSDYINASYVDGYAQKGAYIATQGPLLNTIEDFWRMVWEKEVHVIVMLTQPEEKGKEQCAIYWPETTNSPEKHDSFTVELLSETTYEDYVVRQLKVTDVTATTSSSRIVRHFHFQAWPENGAPVSGAGMIDLVDQVNRAQQQTGNKSIVIHCSAGIGRTGAFCALSLAIERVKAEGMVDIFHTIKHLRTQRPHMVQTVEQYIFCYRAIKEYVDSLSQYSNFQ